MFNNNEIKILKNMTVLQLAEMLEDGLINACWLNEDITVHDFFKEYLIKLYMEMYYDERDK
jgi:hypothetical protein